jgi:hypothetical protein
MGHHGFICHGQARLLITRLPKITLPLTMPKSILTLRAKPKNHAFICSIYTPTDQSSSIQNIYHSWSTSRYLHGDQCISWSLHLEEGVALRLMTHPLVLDPVTVPLSMSPRITKQCLLQDLISQICDFIWYMFASYRWAMHIFTTYRPKNINIIEQLDKYGWVSNILLKY